MKLELIGKPLGHSWSPEIHKFPTGENYSLTELSGYNTDYTGLSRMIDRRGIDAEGGRVCILGSGGASKAAGEVCRAKGWDYDIVSRRSGEGHITYDELYERGKDYTLLINATTVGMFPDVDDCPVESEKLNRLRYVVDIVANPVRTRLCFEASMRGIKTCGGLEMLVTQALAADELFLGRIMDEELIAGCMAHLLRERRNIVLIGMPSSGKTTIGRIIAEKSGRDFIDNDDEIIKRTGIAIADFFEKNGEAEFRRIEAEVCKELSKEQGKIIATGGGAVESEENMRTLSYNGLLVYLDTPMELLTPTDSRPLSADTDKLRKLYERRLPLYRMYADVSVDNSRGLGTAADEIIRLADITI